MKVYLVGGAVRDMFMGKTPKDKDYVVVGSSEKEMLDLGYSKVGQHFPVFLHPETGEEYALARKERSTGNGYGEFVFETEGVSLEEDLLRRDFTMNSMAWDEETKTFIDPYGGRKDIKDHIIRHTSKAFEEDPLRIFRALRFAARYGFAISRDTVVLIREMVTRGMLSSLPNERVFKELEKVYSDGPIRDFFVQGIYEYPLFDRHSYGFGPTNIMEETLFESFYKRSEWNWPNRHCSFNEWLAQFILLNRCLGNTVKLKEGPWIPSEILGLLKTSETGEHSKNPFDNINPYGFYSRFKTFQTREKVAQWVRCSNFSVKDGYMILMMFDRWVEYFKGPVAVPERARITKELEGKGRLIKEALDDFYVEWFKKELGYI